MWKYSLKYLPKYATTYNIGDLHAIMRITYSFFVIMIPTVMPSKWNVIFGTEKKTQEVITKFVSAVSRYSKNQAYGESDWYVKDDFKDIFQILHLK